MTVGVKICGINSAEAFGTCVACEVEWIGFVFYPPSPRYVKPAFAAELSARLKGGPLRVGLLVEPTDKEIAALFGEFRPDILQVYAAAPRVAEIGTRFATTVWRAIGARSPADLPTYAAGANGFVIEAPATPGTRPGGNARPFDWAIMSGWEAPAPWLLAGGLTPKNVALAIETTSAKAVDVSSGVETAPGKKDPALIRAFVTQARTHHT